MASVFDNVPLAPEDAIFGLAAQCKADPAPDKINLIIGAYRTEEGQPWVLPCVLAAEKKIVAELEAGEINHEYLAIEGLPAFTKVSLELALGEDSPALRENRAVAVQSLSGTGALREGFEFLSEFYTKSRTVYVPSPTWSIHFDIAKKVRLEAKTYRYWDANKRGLDFDGMCADLESAPNGSIVILHACAHNPTGCDPTAEQWEALAELFKRKEHFAFIDSAYQGFASGNPARDRLGIVKFVEKGLELFVAQSYAKNFGLYGERVGCLSMVAANSQAAQILLSQLKKVTRPSFSNPPSQGARIVAKVLGSPELKAEWFRNIETMSSRIREMRRLLLEALTSLGTPGTWDHVTNQIGMFCFTGLNPKQVQYMQDTFHVYLLPNGRINVCGINTKNVKRVAEVIDAAVRNVE